MPVSSMSRESPSKATKERVAYIAKQEIIECGKIAKNICQHSGSREVLLKSAKKMASQEHSMENTLTNLRHIERLQEKALEQANRVGRSMEQTSVVHGQLKGILGE